MRSAKPARAAKIGYLIMSGLLCLMGVLIIRYPEASLRTVSILCGLMMIAFGIVKLIGYFSRDLFRLAFENDLSFGSLMLVLGSSLLLHREGSLSFFCTVIGILILTDGFVKVQISVEARPFGIRQWPLLIVVAAEALGIDKVLGNFVALKALPHLVVENLVFLHLLLAKANANLCKCFHERFKRAFPEVKERVVDVD